MKDSTMFSFIKYNPNWDKICTENHELNYHFYEENDENLYLFFQESADKKDWKDNFNFWPKPCKVYKNQENHLICHRGFVEEYKSGNDEIMAILQKKISEKNYKKIILGGWSNGAAVVKLAAEDMYFRTKIKPTVVTFGSPKLCFDRKTARHIKSCCQEIREYCNENDIVTKVPSFFWHVGKISIGKKEIFGIFNPQKYHTNYEYELTKIGK